MNPSKEEQQSSAQEAETQVSTEHQEAEQAAPRQGKVTEHVLAAQVALEERFGQSGKTEWYGRLHSILLQARQVCLSLGDI